VCAGPARRFPADLHHEREDIEAQLAALAKTTSQATDPALLNQLPISGDVLPDLPSALKAPPVRRLRPGSAVEQAGQQATVFAEITDATLAAVPGILDPSQTGYHDTNPVTITNGPGLTGI
jgi:hypothetical protein